MFVVMFRSLSAFRSWHIIYPGRNHSKRSLVRLFHLLLLFFLLLLLLFVLSFLLLFLLFTFSR